MRAAKSISVTTANAASWPLAIGGTVPPAPAFAAGPIAASSGAEKRSTILFSKVECTPRPGQPMAPGVARSRYPSDSIDPCSGWRASPM